MQIGELSRRSGASVRSLRHYEQQGLLSSERRVSGYRDYPANAVAIVQNIRSLLEIGMQTVAVEGCIALCGRETRRIGLIATARTRRGTT